MKKKERKKEGHVFQSPRGYFHLFYLVINLKNVIIEKEDKVLVIFTMVMVWTFTYKIRKQLFFSLKKTKIRSATIHHNLLER